MNPDKPTTAPAAESFKDNIKRAAELLKFNHLGEHTVMVEAGDALRQANQFSVYERELTAAWNLHQDIEKITEDLTAEDDNRSFTTYEGELLDTLREKTKEYGQIYNKIRDVLVELGYGVEEEGEPTQEDSFVSSPAESEVVPETPIEKLTSLYRNADPSVFIDSVVQGRVHKKRFQVINDEIWKVLRHAHFDNDTVKIFMNETVKSIRSAVREKSKQQSETSDRREKLVLSTEINEKYNELLDKVATFMREEEVLVAQSAETDESLMGAEGDIDQKIESVLQEFDLFKQSGVYTEDESFLQAEKAVERLAQHDEKDPVVAAHDKQRYLRILTAALGKLSVLSSSLDLSSEKTKPVYPIVTLTDVANTATQTPQVAESVPKVAPEEKYEKKYEAHFEGKKNYKEKNREYKDAIKAYYQDSSWQAKFRNGLNGAKKVFGINPELPPALQAMKDETRTLRRMYVHSLAGALKERGEREGNEAFYIGNNQTKVAFGRKFILEPNQEMLKLQEGALPSETMERVQKVMQTFSKYKWHTRVGTVALAGTIGFASGGVGALLAGASYQAWKIAASTGMGAGAGLLTRNAMQERTEAAREGAISAESRATKKFSLANLEELETKLEQAQSLKNVRERQQKVATIAAAVAAGGLTGYSLSQFDGGTDAVPANGEGLSDEALSEIVDHEIAPETTVTPPVVESQANVEPVPVPIENFTISGIRVPLYGFSGNLEYSTVLSDIKVNGAFSNGALPEADRLAVEQFIAQSTNDLLSAHPNISETKLEAELLTKVQGKFGSAPWFAASGITGIDIGTINVVPAGGLGVSVPLEASETAVSGGTKVDVNIGDSQRSYTEATSTKSEAAPTIERGSGSYVVQKGDTLSEITEKRFAEQLKTVPVEKRGVLLEQLLKNIEADPTLRDSIGMRSGDIDLIYANEKLNLDGVEAELSRLLEREQILESFRTSGPLSVEADADVKEVPITVVEKPVPVPPPAVEVVTDSGRVYTEAAAPVVEKSVELVPPRAYSLNGQYAEHPEYKNYIEKTFGSTKTFEVAVEKSVQNFDNSTYDVFERPGFFSSGEYESPYRFLGEMTLEEAKEFAAQPNEEVRSFLKENNMKYDTYLAWLTQIDSMVQTLPNQPETTVSDLFERFVAETQAPKANPLIKTS